MFRSPKKSKQQAQFQAQGRQQQRQQPQPQPQQQSQSSQAQQPAQVHSKHHIPNPFSTKKHSPKAIASPSFTTNSGFSTPPRANPSPVNSNQSKFTSPGSPVGSSNSEQQRKVVTDKIISDCYSKVIFEGDKKLNEVSYITHIGVIEYSHSPSAPPPPNSNPGSVKHRILVLCKKHSGRMQLQKGKFQSDKNYYQIGRTWDLSELQTIKKAGRDGFILQLNKTYYWKCDEDDRRVWKFARYLCQNYGMFTGRYPTLDGFNIDDFMLPAIPKSPSATPTRSSSVKDPVADPQLMKSRSLKKKNMPNPILPSIPAAAPVPSQTLNNVSKTQNLGTPNANDLYRDMDFTVNGGLPQKPMKVMLREATSNNSGSTLDPGPSLYGPSTRTNKTQPQSQPQTQTQPAPYAQTQPQAQTQTQPRSQAFPKIGAIETRDDQRNRVLKEDLNQMPPPPIKSNQHPYYQKSPMYGLDTASEMSNDSHSFIFNTREASQEKLEDKMPGDMLEPVSEAGGLGQGNEPWLPTSHHYANNTHVKQGSHVSEKSAEDVVKEFSEAIPTSQRKSKMAASATVPDFGVEEITDDSEDDQRPAPTFSIRKRQQQRQNKAKQNDPVTERHTGLEEPSQDVSDGFMDNKSRKDDFDRSSRFDLDKSSRYDDKTFVSQKGLGIYPPNSNSFIEESTKIEGQTRIDSHMQEIQDMLNSHLGGDANDDDISHEFNDDIDDDIDDDDNNTNGHIYEDHDNLNDDLNEDSGALVQKSVKQKNNDALEVADEFEDDGDNSFEPGLNIVKKSATPEGGDVSGVGGVGGVGGGGGVRSSSVILSESDRDVEIDNILDGIGWSVQDDADTLIKKLNKELTNIKQDVVSKLVHIDLNNNSGSDIGSALSEVDNMTNIFQKMEIKLKLLHNDLQNAVYT